MIRRYSRGLFQQDRPKADMSGSGFLQRKLIIESHFAERNSRCNPHFENWRNPAFGMGDAAGALEQAAKMQSRSMVAQQLATTKALRPKNTHIGR